MLTINTSVVNNLPIQRRNHEKRHRRHLIWRTKRSNPLHLSIPQKPAGSAGHNIHGFPRPIRKATLLLHLFCIYPMHEEVFGLKVAGDFGSTCEKSVAFHTEGQKESSSLKAFLTFF